MTLDEMRRGGLAPHMEEYIRVMLENDVPLAYGISGSGRLNIITAQDVPQADVHQGIHQDEMDMSIIRIIRENGKISVNQMTEQLHVSVKTIRCHIDNLPFIRNVGSGYSGHWEIVGETEPKGN